jgi:hypothetical protein
MWVVVTLPVLEKRESRKKPVTASPEPEKRVQLVAETRQEEPEGETPPTDVQTTTHKTFKRRYNPKHPQNRAIAVGA